MKYRVILETYKGELGGRLRTFILCEARDKTEAGRRAWQEMTSREAGSELPDLLGAIPGEKIIGVWKYQGVRDSAWEFGERVRNEWREWWRWRPHTIDIDAAPPVDDEDELISN